MLTPTTANDAAAGLSNMLHNLGGAVGTASLGTIMTKREPYHSNIIGQPVTLARDEMRERIDQTAGYFMAHGISDPSVVTQRAIVTLGHAVRRQALILGFSDTFAVIRVILAIAAIASLLTHKTAAGGGAGAH